MVKRGPRGEHVDRATTVLRYWLCVDEQETVTTHLEISGRGDISFLWPYTVSSRLRSLGNMKRQISV